MASAPRKTALSEGELLGHSPPPYYEANAYPTVGSRRLRRLFSLRVGLALVLTCAVSWLCLLVARETRLDTAARQAASPLRASQFASSLSQCAAIRRFPSRIDPADRKSNPRWNAANGQTEAVVLRNATLFDGESFGSGPVDIVFEKGLIVSVSAAGSEGNGRWAGTATAYDLAGQFVTPGLVDMHSHHMVMPWPSTQATEDGNEVHADFGPLTPFVRALDGMKAYDHATALIASGGVTSSLIIPGSSNVMGGEGTVVKNRMRPGADKEFVVEELLLEHGIPVEERHRYMKMACGENPKGTYGHNRMGNAWVLRKHLARAKELLEKQDAWCAAAERLESRGDGDAQRRFLEQMGGGFPEELELDSTVGMLRGRVAMHNHCYEPEDFETMLRISHEFGFRVRAFHHAIAAWRVPEMLKDMGDNVTIATFAEFGLYKSEAYDASLYAGKILSDHGVPLAYKSDHAETLTSAKELLSQAAIAHSFHVPADIALRAVTSVPAKAIDMDHRVGFARAGFDADLVIWDSHPLSIGATPRQVFIDGVATLDPAKVKETMDDQVAKAPARSSAELPRMRPTVAENAKKDFCARAGEKGQTVIVTGIRGSFLENHPGLAVAGLDIQETLGTGSNLTLVVADGKIACLGSSSHCESHVTEASQSGAAELHLSNGYLAPGLTAVTMTLGLVEIFIGQETSNGAVSPFLDPKDKANVDYAKYGVVLEGKAFVRARMGGVTRAITPPLSLGGLVRGVSTGLLTSGKRRLVDGGIFQDDIAVHVDLGDMAKVSPGAISMAIQELRSQMSLAAAAIQDQRTASGDEAAFVAVLQGHMPLVVQARSVHDIEQVILLKRDLTKMASFKFLNIVIYGGHGAHQVADALAEASIPVILTANRVGDATWETKDTLPGPPLSRSAASVLSEAGVLYALALEGDPPQGESRIHDLAFEASWAAKFAGLSDRDALRLVSRNVEEILGLNPSGDVVVWEGSPLQLGSRPAVAFQALGAGLELATCWPDEDDQ